MIKGYMKKLLIIIILVTAGILLEIAGLLDAGALLGIARQYADHWWLALILILLQAVLFTFAQPGSFLLWIVAPLYPPVIATIILAAGGTIGGIGAYLFSKQLTDEWVDRIEHSPVYRLLQNQGNFFTLFALRVFPGFPHSLINYSAGILKLKPVHFTAAAIAGLTIKSLIYSSAIHNATSAASLYGLLDISIYGPLISLSLLSLVGIFIRYKLSGRHNNSPH